ncbi:proline hydroxylase [Paraburkholderia sp. BCC1886]|uniref:proline hydroxylase n=1 Tax=Paraburkholderia sp. BCC1886 TaxID=2562670 RepID=UPI001182D615|nr:proline hydroxylase [Paraburkholderia sp. BCC1886]
MSLAERIAVHDNFVPEELKASILALLKRNIWRYGWKSNSKNDRFQFWHAHFAGGDHNNRTGCADELANNRNAVPIARLWDLLSKTILQGHEPLRVYANAHTYGIEGYVHVDNKDTENYYSTIIYAADQWKGSWGGETLFFDFGERDILKAVPAMPFRAVSFPGHIPHKANAPTRECPELRQCVVFKSQVAPRLVVPKGMAA